MSHTINFASALLDVARNLQDRGQDAAALKLLKRLTLFRQLDRRIAEEVHSRIAELYAARELFKKARRHLAIALTLQPQCAAYHHKMAQWIEFDPDAAPERARQYYDRAVRSDPDSGEIWADYGAYLISEGRIDAGAKALHRAFDLASHDPDLVGLITASLREANLWDDASNLLRRALFENSGDRRYRDLYREHQFARLSAKQRDVDEVPIPRKTPRAVILRFVGNCRPSPTLHVEGKIIRIDHAGEAGQSNLPVPRRQPTKPHNRRSR